MRDPYAVLGVDSNASDKEIKSAWRTTAKALHPDRNRDDPAAASLFAEAGKAYDMLKNPAKRSLLDQARNSAAGKPGEPTFMQKREEAQAAAARKAERLAREAREAEALAELARQANAAARATQAEQTKEQSETRGATGKAKAGGKAKTADKAPKEGDLFNEEVDQQDAASLQSSAPLKLQAADLLVSFYRRLTGYRPPAEQAPDYHLDASVTIADLLAGRWATVETPDERDVGFYLTPGMTDGHVIELKGHGARLPGLRNGDLLVTLRVAKDIAFSVDGFDIHTILPISLEDAVLGLETEVQGPEGTAPITVEPWSGSEKTIRISSHGLKKEDGERGDLVVELRIFLGERPDEKVTDLMRVMRQGLYL